MIAMFLPVQAEYWFTRTAASSHFVEFQAVEPVRADLNPSNKALLMQANLLVHRPLTITYRNVLRCRVLDDPLERFVDSSSVTVPYEERTRLGHVDAPSTAYVAKDGRWEWPGRLPPAPSTCVMEVTAQFRPGGGEVLKSSFASSAPFLVTPATETWAADE